MSQSVTVLDPRTPRPLIPTLPWHYILTPHEQQQAEDLAVARQAIKAKLNVQTQKVGQQYSDLDLHRMACQSELACARMLGEGWDLDWSVTPRGNKLFALRYRLPSGRLLTAEVKYRAVHGWDFGLFTTNPNDLKADFALLVWPATASMSIFPAHAYRLVGWTTRDHLRTDGEVVDWKHGQRLTMPWYKMGDPNLLRAQVDALKGR